MDEVTRLYALKQWVHADELMGITSIPFDVQYPSKDSQPIARTTPVSHKPSESYSQPKRRTTSLVTSPASAPEMKQVGGEKGKCHVAFVGVTERPSDSSQPYPWPTDEYQLIEKMCGPQAMNLNLSQRSMVHVYGEALDIKQVAELLLEHFATYGIKHVVLMSSMAYEVFATERLSIAQARGKEIQLASGIRALMTLPPSYILNARDPLRQRDYRSQVWKDLQQVMAWYN